MGNLALARMSGCLVAALVWWPGITEAATYQLRVASVPERVFMYFVEGSTLPRIEAFLDDASRSKFVLLRDRQPQLLQTVVSDPSSPPPVAVKLPEPNDRWGPATWDGEPGQLVVFRIRGIQSDQQRLKRVAVQTDGVLARIPVGGVHGPQTQAISVPVAAAGYLTRALESSAFPDWIERRAASHQGLSVIVGRHHSPRESDTVYLAVRMPQTDRTFKVILGWKTVRREGPYAITPGRQY